MNRNLDGIYFRIKRGDKYENVCFSDLTEDERRDMEARAISTGINLAEWYKRIAWHLADCLKEIGDELDLIGE